MGHLYINVNLSNDDDDAKHRNRNMVLQKHCQHNKLMQNRDGSAKHIKLTQNRETKQNVESINIEK